ncbi:hypothetical protein [Bacillus sp. AK128]
MKPIKIVSEELKNALNDREPYIQVGERKFLLMEVQQIREPNVYEVTDSDEKALLERALQKGNRILSDEEIDKLMEEKQ